MFLLFAELCCGSPGRLLGPLPIPQLKCFHFALMVILKNSTCCFKTKVWEFFVPTHTCPVSQMRMLTSTEMISCSLKTLSCDPHFAFLEVEKESEGKMAGWLEQCLCEAASQLVKKNHCCFGSENGGGKWGAIVLLHVLQQMPCTA